MIHSDAVAACRRCGDIFFTRHCSTEWNDDGRLQGSCDIPLSEVGREQARILAKAISKTPVKVLVTSQLQRTVETAEIIRQSCGARVVVCSDLSEIMFGKLEGLTRNHCETEYAALMQAWRKAPQTICFPGGEAIKDFEARVIYGLRMTLGLLSEPALFVLHGGVLRLAKCLFERRPISEMNRELIANATIFRLSVGIEGLELKRCDF